MSNDVHKTKSNDVHKTKSNDVHKTKVLFHISVCC